VGGVLRVFKILNIINATHLMVQGHLKGKLDSLSENPKKAKDQIKRPEFNKDDILASVIPELKRTKLDWDADFGGLPASLHEGKVLFDPENDEEKNKIDKKENCFWSCHFDQIDLVAKSLHVLPPLPMYTFRFDDQLPVPTIYKKSVYRDIIAVFEPFYRTILKPVLAVMQDILIEVTLEVILPEMLVAIETSMLTRRSARLMGMNIKATGGTQLVSRALKSFNVKNNRFQIQQNGNSVDIKVFDPKATISSGNSDKLAQYIQTEEGVMRYLERNNLLKQVNFKGGGVSKPAVEVPCISNVSNSSIPNLASLKERFLVQPLDMALGLVGVAGAKNNPCLNIEIGKLKKIQELPNGVKEKLLILTISSNNFIK
jgi:hypothetical protein